VSAISPSHCPKRGVGCVSCSGSLGRISVQHSSGTVKVGAVTPLAKNGAVVYSERDRGGTDEKFPLP